VIVSTELFSLQGKVGIVTGASRGIGRAIALGFARAGADLALAARTKADLESLKDEVESIGRRAIAVPTDVNERDQIENLVERTVTDLGGLDILVNNAGGARFTAPLLGLRPEGWTKVMRVNADATFHSTQLAALRMVDAGGGSIIQMSSVAGLQGAMTLSFYSAAKGAIRLMSQAVAKELAESGVRVNSIAPGWIATELNANLRENTDSNRSVVSSVPMGRWGQAEEVVGAAIFLASDASSFVTGATIVVDGGQTA
jgi:NAD(P)-dependent dehydrogenase (short-subunit alcohol dehydrogenase family)